MPVFIGSTPNSQKDDVVLAKNILKNEISTNGSIKLLKDRLPKNAFLFNKGRDSLNFFLSLLNLREGDEVITQAFTCVAVVAPIIWNKATPVYIDIDPKSFNMDLNLLKESITSKTRAVIIQHTFGNITDVRRAREIIDTVNQKREQSRKIYLIEDCAHIFIKNPTDLDLGRYSDAYFFSFSQDKSISSTQGAVLFFNHSNIGESIENKAEEKYSGLEEISKEESRYCARYIIVWDRIKRNYFKTIIPFSSITLGKVMLILYRFLGIIKKQASADTLEYSTPKKMSDIQASLLLNQLDKVEKYNNHRVGVVNNYNTKLNCEFKFNSNNNILIRYPVLLQNRAEIKERLREENIISGVWYSSVVFPLMDDKMLEKVKYKKGMCPRAEECSNKVINLPTNIEVTEIESDKIINMVNNFAKPFNID